VPEIGSPNLTAETRRKAKVGKPKTLTVFAIQQLAHGLAAGFIGVPGVLALDGVHAALGRRLGWLCFTTLRTAVGKAGLVRLELKLLRANNANFNGKGHAVLGYREWESVVQKRLEPDQVFGLAFSLAWPFCNSTVYSTALQPYSFCSCAVFCFTNFLNESRLAAFFSPVFWRASVSA
jgi:hypothetical protein